MTEHLKERKRDRVFFLVVLVIFLSAPLFMDYIPNGSRVGLYFLETQGIRGPFLWIPVLLHRMGMGVVGSWRLYLLCLNIATCVVAWWCFARMAGDAYGGLAAAICYSFSMYSIYIRYVRASFGETAAFLFLPLMVCGFYELYRRERKDQGSTLLFLGIVGVCLACVPIAMIALGFLLLAAVILWRQTFREKRWLWLALSVVLGLGLSVGIWYTYAKAVLAGGLYADTSAGTSFAERGMQIAEVFLPFSGNLGVYREDMTAGIYAVPRQGVGIGLPFLSVLVAMVIDGRQKARSYWLQGGLALLAICMSTTAFPWRSIQGIHWLPRVLLEHVGYPYRFLAVAVVLLSGVVGLLGVEMRKKGKKYMAVFMLCVVVLNIFSGVYLMDDWMYTTEQNLSTEADEGVQGREYLFYMSE